MIRHRRDKVGACPVQHFKHCLFVAVAAAATATGVTLTPVPTDGQRAADSCAHLGRVMITVQHISTKSGQNKHHTSADIISLPTFATS